MTEHRNVITKRKSFYKKHSLNRAISRFDYSKREVAEILNLIKKGRYVNKEIGRGRIVYELWFNNEQVRVVYDVNLKEIITFLYEDEFYKELEN